MLPWTASGTATTFHRVVSDFRSWSRAPIGWMWFHLPGGPHRLSYRQPPYRPCRGGRLPLSNRAPAVSPCLNPGPALHIDVPIDPESTSPWVTKTVSQDVAAIGDFIQYKVEVQNPAQGMLRDVTLSDQLPFGFRYQSGSLKMNGVTFDDPTISPDGRTLSITLGDCRVTQKQPYDMSWRWLPAPGRARPPTVLLP